MIGFKQILFEYADRFDNVDPQSFLDNWNKYGKALQDLLNTQYKASGFASMWPEDIERILGLLKLFPPSKIGKNSVANSEVFQRAAKKLFVFRSVNIEFFSFHFCLTKFQLKYIEVYKL